MIPQFTGQPAYGLTPLQGEEDYCLDFGRSNPGILKFLKGKYSGKTHDERYAQFLEVKKMAFPKAKGEWSVLFEFYNTKGFIIEDHRNYLDFSEEGAIHCSKKAAYVFPTRQEAQAKIDSLGIELASIIQL